MDGEYVQFDVEEEVATVTLDHPDVRNALTRGVSSGVIDAVEAAEDSDARAVVLAATGETFCAGGDINAMLRSMEEDVDPAERRERVLEGVAGCIRAVAECDLPTVAKIQGPAFGAGGTLAIAADVQLASEAAAISFGFRQVGLSIDGGTSYFLPRTVGENVAKELVYTGEMVDAERATDLGLFNHVYPAESFDERVAEFVEQVASGPTRALTASKRLIEQGLDHSLDQALDAEVAEQGVVAQSDDHAEGVAAFTEKRDPEFTGE